MTITTIILTKSQFNLLIEDWKAYHNFSTFGFYDWIEKNTDLM